MPWTSDTGTIGGMAIYSTTCDNTAYTIDSSSSITASGTWVAGNVVFQNWDHANYVWQACASVGWIPITLDLVDQKIQRERDWIHMMAFRSEQRAIDLAETTALDLVAELFGSGDADWLVVPSKLHPGRVYRVPIKDKSMRGSMVRVEENGKLLHKLCAHPSLSLPAGDHAIAKASFLGSNEAAFLAVANVH